MTKTTYIVKHQETDTITLVSVYHMEGYPSYWGYGNESYLQVLDRSARTKILFNGDLEYALEKIGFLILMGPTSTEVI